MTFSVASKGKTYFFFYNRIVFHCVNAVDKWIAKMFLKWNGITYMYLLPIDTKTNYHNLSSLKQHKFLLIGGQKFTIKVSAELTSF